MFHTQVGSFSQLFLGKVVAPSEFFELKVEPPGGDLLPEFCYNILRPFVSSSIDISSELLMMG
jgi:hypothetical protein